MIAITGATGQLGQLVIEELLKTVPASQIVAIVRNPAKAEALSNQGIVVRQGDYTDQAAFTTALNGVDKLLLISSSEVGLRATQHQNVINAAKAAGVKFIAYTSLLHADTSPLGLHVEHVETEKALAESGVPYALLRNGWYTENYLASAPPALEHGVFIGAAGEGKIASATRADYAAAAAKVVSEDGHAGNVYELAGDSAWTLSELAAELSKQSGKPVAYQNLSEADFAAALKGVGLPAGLADYSYRAAWPAGPARNSLPSGHNIGLILRWQAALAEIMAFGAIPRVVVRDRLRTFLAAVTAQIAGRPVLELLPPVAPVRPAPDQAWDCLPTIMSFFVRAPDSPEGGFRPLAVAEARQLYAWLNTDLSGCIPPDDADAGLAAVLCHVGQPVPLAHPALPGALAGALRISAGARLVSGEPSHEGMDPTERLRREARNVGRILDKIGLILRHWPRLAAMAPVQTYLPHGWRARAILPA